MEYILDGIYRFFIPKSTFELIFQLIVEEKNIFNPILLRLINYKFVL